MQLTDFRIRELVFEVRYDEAYILWDVAGKLHQELARLWPGSSLQKVEATEQVLKSDTAELHTGVRQSRVHVYAPSTVVKFGEQLSETLRLWAEYMSIAKLKRVGTRVMFQRKYPSAEDADSAMVSLGLVRHPQPPFFNHKVPAHTHEVRVLWQDDTSQTQLIVKTEHHRVEISTVDEPTAKDTKTGDFVIIDIDRATRGTTELTRFRVVDWLEGVQHLINRDVPKLLTK